MDEMRSINISRGATTIVDDEDFDLLNSYNWSSIPKDNTDYVVRKGRRRTCEPRTVQMHRQIMGYPVGVQIDHINGNGLDNRKSNLRIASVQTNSFNRAKPRVLCTSRYKGVLQRKGKVIWESRVKYNDKAIHLGSFTSEEDAAAAYNYGALLMYGEYARFNDVLGVSTGIRTMIYNRCLTQVVKRGWCPTTGAFSFESLSRKACAND